MKVKTTPTESITRQISAYGFRSFLDAADTELKILEEGSVEHTILDYLRKHAVGSQNAKPWVKIEEHIEKLGHKMSQNKFQNGLVQRSRRSTFYIGSSHAGYFLFEKQLDVAATCAFYKGRIGKEQENWNSLLYLESQANFQKPDSRELQPVEED